MPPAEGRPVKRTLPWLVIAAAVAVGLACNTPDRDEGEDAAVATLEQASDLTVREFDQQDVIYFVNPDIEGGSTVIFPHTKHSGVIDVSCYFCHHQDLEGERPRPCRMCHHKDRVVDGAPTSKTAFHERCIGCHEKVNEEDPKWNVALKCAECHIPDRTQQRGVADQ